MALGSPIAYMNGKDHHKNIEMRNVQKFQGRVTAAKM
jgi:hypothetical protein